MKECQSQWHHHVAMLLVGIALLAPLTSAENARELGLLGPGCFLWRIHRKSRSVLPHANNLCSVGVTRSEEGKTPHRRNSWVANTQKKMLTASGIHSTCYILVVWNHPISNVHGVHRLCGIDPYYKAQGMFDGFISWPQDVNNTFKPLPQHGGPWMPMQAWSVIASLTIHI